MLIQSSDFDNGTSAYEERHLSNLADRNYGNEETHHDL